MTDQKTPSLVDSAPRQIGSFEVPALAFGCWRFVQHDLASATRLIEAALDAGLTLVDTADVYGFDWGGDGFGDAETRLGHVLAANPGLRDRMVLATKGGIAPPVPYDSSPEYLRSACEASLRRLQVESVDLYQIHRPDMFTHPAEVAATLTALRNEGKVREVGTSNFTAAQHEALQAHLDFPLAVSQVEFSPAHLEPMRNAMFDMCMRLGTTPIAWSPLAGGRLLTGEGVRPELIAVLDRLAERENVDRATIAVAFTLSHPARPVTILGTQNVERLAEASKAFDVVLDRNDCYDIVEASKGVPLP